MSRWQNLLTIGNNVGQTLIQDVTSLRTSAALLYTTVQVALRCGVALRSSMLPGPPEEVRYRKRESAEVCFREVVGFSASWLAIRMVETFTRGQLEKAYGYRIVRPGTTGPMAGLKQAWEVLRGRLNTVMPAPEALTSQAIYERLPTQATGVLGRLFRTLGNAFAGVFRQANPEAMLKGFRFVHDYLPPAIGAIPALLLSGWLLERATLIHGKALFDAILGHRGDVDVARLPATATSYPKMAALSQPGAGFSTADSFQSVATLGGWAPYAGAFPVGVSPNPNPQPFPVVQAPAAPRPTNPAWARAYPASPVSLHRTYF
ncbi:MAG: hypothetical protein SFZ03_11365 [Candidatus Melainabacteria bacterium]|nr:hypothetical protein [Candidatus Melainabacteria bacterium]